MSLPPKDNDLVGILNDLENKLHELEFLTSGKNFNSGSGIMGPQGPQGLTGATGPQGAAATIAIGSVTTTASGTNASINNSGTSNAAILDFNIPRGNTGTAATISVGTVTSGATASVTNSGTSSAAVFNFVLPKGDTGPPGPQGTSGNDLISARVIFLS